MDVMKKLFFSLSTLVLITACSDNSSINMEYLHGVWECKFSPKYGSHSGKINANLKLGKDNKYNMDFLIHRFEDPESYIIEIMQNGSFMVEGNIIKLNTTESTFNDKKPISNKHKDIVTMLSEAFYAPSKSELTVTHLDKNNLVITEDEGLSSFECSRK